jgi:hypothetical protein
MSDGKRHLRVLQPTMSSAGLLLACQWPWGRPISSIPLDRIEPVQGAAPVDFDLPHGQAIWATVKDETNEHANYGNALHEVLAAQIVSPPIKWKPKAAAAKWGIEDVPAFKAHAEEAVDTFIRWMMKKNPWGIDLTKHAKIRTEMAVAYNVEKNKTRLTARPTADTHEYKGIEVGELPGTADVVIDEISAKAKLEGAPDIIVIDHKTGDGWNMPLENAQLKGLTTANMVRIGAKTAAMGIFHSPVENVSTMYIDETDRDEINLFRDQLKTAWGRIGDGSLRPGPHCSFCPAATICPTQASAIVQVETTLTMTPERVGEIVMKLDAFMKTGEKMEKEVKAWIKLYGLPSGDGTRAVPLPSGKWYRGKPTKRAGWQVSTKALREVLGIDKAEEIIKALKAAGHLKDSEYDDWRVVNDT